MVVMGISCRWNQNTSIADTEQNSQQVAVFPNPSTGKFTVSANIGSINAIEIYNAMGTKVFSTSKVKLLAVNELDISDLAKGMYFIKIDGREKIYSEKILIE
ncbi:MAG: T9SS type A sorting domain-containing protein [Bacteroidales bacterium]|nr:T9SS type A sorting domain-containing protein [Bacteroidales bacterium]